MVFKKGHPNYRKAGFRWSEEVKKKMSEGQKGKRLSPATKEKIRKAMLGRKITWGDKIGKANLGRKMTDKARKNMSISHIGKKIPKEQRLKISKSVKLAFKRPEVERNLILGRIKALNNPERNKKISKAMKGRKITWGNKLRESNLKTWQDKELLKRHSDMNKGSKNPAYGRSVPNAVGGYYKGIWMKSSWEIIFAKHLDKLKFNWKYEPKRFYYENFSYLPDFFIEELGFYVEIKGLWRNGDLDKVNKFKESYPLVVIDNISPYKKCQP